MKKKVAFWVKLLRDISLLEQAHKTSPTPSGLSKLTFLIGELQDILNQKSFTV